MHLTSTFKITLLALLWGSGFLWIKIALRGLSPVEIVFAQVLLGAAALIIIIYVFQRQRLPGGWRLWFQLTIAAALANATPYLLFAIAERTVPSSTAGIINATTPLLTTALVILVDRKYSLTYSQITGLILGFVGCLLIFSPWQTATAIMSWGGLACLIASLSYAASYIYMARNLANRDLSPLVLSAAQLTAATGILALALPATGIDKPSFRLDVTLAVLVLGLISTGAAYVLNYRIIMDDGPVAASVVTYLIPIVSIGLGVAVLSEAVTLTMVVGVAVVLLGVGLTRRLQAQQSVTP